MADERHLMIPAACLPWLRVPRKAKLDFFTRCVSKKIRIKEMVIPSHCYAKCIFTQAVLHDTVRTPALT